MLEKQIEDYWNVDGDQELTDAWTGFTRFVLIKKRPPDGLAWSRRRLTRKQTSRPDDVWPDMWKSMSDAPKRKQSKDGQSRNQKMQDNEEEHSSLSQKMKKSSSQ